MKTPKRNSFGKNQVLTLSTYNAVLPISYKKFTEVIDSGVIDYKEIRLDKSKHAWFHDMGEYSFYDGIKIYSDSTREHFLNKNISSNKNTKEILSNINEIINWEIEMDDKEILKKFLSHFPGGDKVQINTTTFSVGDKVKIKPKYKANVEFLLVKGKFSCPAGGYDGIRCGVHGDNPIGKEGIITELKKTHEGKSVYNAIVDFPNLCKPETINRLELIK